MQQAKQQFLRKEIIENDYNPRIFAGFLAEQRDGGSYI